MRRAHRRRRGAGRQLSTAGVSSARSAQRVWAPARSRSAPGWRARPTRRWGRCATAEHGQQPAARFRAERCAEHLFLGPGRHRGRSVVQRPGAAATPPIQRLWTGALWAEGPAWNAGRPLPGLERHPEQPADALASRTTAASPCSAAVQQQQRQHLRLPGPADLLRALTRRVVRYELDGSVDGPRRLLQGQAAQLAQRRRAASGRQRLVHRPALRRASSTRARPMPPAGRATRRAPSIRARPARRRRRPRSASCRPRSTAGTRAAGSTLVITEDQVPDPNGLCFSPDYKKLYVASTGKGRATPARAARATSTSSTSARQQAVESAAVHRLHGRRRQVRPGRHPRRRRRQPLGAPATPAATSATAASPCWSPDGKLIGRIRMPEVVRQRLPSAAPSATGCSWPASQSLYAVTRPRRGRRRVDGASV